MDKHVENSKSHGKPGYMSARTNAYNPMPWITWELPFEEQVLFLGSSARTQSLLRFRSTGIALGGPVASGAVPFVHLTAFHLGREYSWLLVWRLQQQP